MFIQLILIVCCLYAFWKFWIRRKSRLEPPKLSGGLPIFGHGLMFFGDSVNNYRNITQLADETLRNGGVTTGDFGLQKAYCLTDPEAILKVSNICVEKEYVYHFAKDFAGDGLVIANATTWRKHRKLLNPAFNQSVLNGFIDIFNSQSQILVEELASHLGTPLDHVETLRHNHLKTIFLTATGVGADDHSLQEKYLSLFPEIQELLSERFSRLWLHYELIYYFSSLKKKLNQYLKVFVGLSSTIIARKKAEIKRIIETSKEIKQGTQKPFLELMLDINSETGCFTDEQIRQETDNMIAAGHETLANVVNLALIILGSNPDMQDKVLKEILEVVGPDSDVTKESLAKLIYTEAVLKETLRLYPVVPVVSRHLDQDVRVKNLLLLKGSYCIFFINGLNRNPNWGPDADQFRPERWLNTDTLPDPNNFGSFSLGKRNCLGKVYAMMSMKTNMVHLLQNYRVTADFSKVVFKWLLLTYPASGNLYTLERRNTKIV